MTVLFNFAAQIDAHSIFYINKHVNKLV